MHPRKAFRFSACPPHPPQAELHSASLRYGGAVARSPRIAMSPLPSRGRLLAGKSHAEASPPLGWRSCHRQVTDEGVSMREAQCTTAGRFTRLCRLFMRLCRNSHDALHLSLRLAELGTSLVRGRSTQAQFSSSPCQGSMVRAGSARSAAEAK